MKHLNTFLFILIFTQTLFGQGVSINETGTVPDTSAMLDVQSNSKGVLIPRLTTAQRTGIFAPAAGLLVYDINTASFWYRLTTTWVELTDNFHGLRDADHDTQVQVEQSPDEDMIRFDIGGDEVLVLNKSTQNATRLEIPNLGLMIGRNAGLSSVAGWNTFLGPEAGRFNTSGQGNVFVGYRAGEDNTTQIRNVFVGMESGANNGGSFNTFTGYRTGYVNSTGHSNAFFGHEAGVQNTTGFRNTFVGYVAGHNNEISDENTFVGFSAGYNNEADQNTFYGYEAGLANRTGIYNTVIGGEAAGTNLSNRDMGNGNTLVGYETAHSANGLIENVLLGYRAGYNMTSGIRNIFIGPNSGLFTINTFANIGIGPGALRSNVAGNRNVAVGDSSLYSNTASGNVALGSKAGMDNTTGTGNTFLGFNAGTNNTTGINNTFIGRQAGMFNINGQYNIAVGVESGSANVDGNENTFMGHLAGFRNISGDDNVFLGRQAGSYNMAGDANIAIGPNAGNYNDDGHHNIALGEYALGNLIANHAAVQNNIGIGFEAGLNGTGNSNIIIGNDSGESIEGSNNILLGNDIVPDGYNNTYLGSSTAASNLPAPHNATAIGYGALISQDHSIILGDASNASVKVGIGTTSPDAKLQIHGNGQDILRLVGGANIDAFSVRHNGIVIVDHTLLVNTNDGKLGYEMSVNGEIVCEELLVQDSLDWPDYVFAKEYPLMDFQNLRSFLNEKQHLPGIPTAVEIANDGLKVGDMQKRLLEKIEELTLYILQLETRINTLENK